MNAKPRFPRHAALKVAREIHLWLKDHCERIIFAGSLRRQKPTVGDIEVLFIPKFATRQIDLLTQGEIPVTDAVFTQLLFDKKLALRLNVKEHATWGKDIKLAVHVASGIPVDFFTATESNWVNYLVCRTGPGSSNIKVASAAKAKGWKWEPYSAGFLNDRGEVVPVECERDVFDFVGLPYGEPWERDFV